jgi:quercetin dioxygenase-like cupin family protein
MIQSTADIAIDPSVETIRLGPLVIRFLVAGEDTSGSAAVFECTVPAGEKLRAPAHSRDAYEETVYGLTGVLTWTVNARPIAVGPGQTLCIPRGAVHRFDNLGQEPAKRSSSCRRRCSVPRTSARRPRQWSPPTAVHQIPHRWWRSCAAMA